MIATGPVILVLVAASPPGGLPPVAGLIDTIDFTALNAFASSWEPVSVSDYPVSSQTILTSPAIETEVRALRQKLLRRWLDGGSAVTKDMLYAEALMLDSDPGSALILCYHVCQMFSRGFETVYWQRVDQYITDGGVIPVGTTTQPRNDPVGDDDYTTGIDFYRPVELNPAQPGEVLKFNGRDSIFWLLFDKSEEWGIEDPGDWYHFFLMASIAYYVATGRTTDMNVPESVRAQLIASLVRSMIQGMQNVGGMSQLPFASMDPYDAAWVWANALSFIEGGIFGAFRGDDKTAAVEDVTHECGVHRKGCLYGLRLAGKTTHPSYLHWWVPTPGELAQDFGVYLAQYHPIDIYDLAQDESEGEFWAALSSIGFDDPGVQGFLELLRSQGPTSRAECVLDGATGLVLSSHPVAGHL
jgi:hypothetical protein